MTRSVRVYRVVRRLKSSPKPTKRSRNGRKLTIEEFPASGRPINDGCSYQTRAEAEAAARRLTETAAYRAERYRDFYYEVVEEKL